MLFAFMQLLIVDTRAHQAMGKPRFQQLHLSQKFIIPVTVDIILMEWPGDSVKQMEHGPDVYLLVRVCNT